MQQRVSLITLGVTNIEAAAKFYEALGWARVKSDDGLVVFDLIGQTLGLYPKSALADELGLDVSDISGFCGITLGHNVASKAEVAPLLERAKTAGAQILKPAQDVFWGGHHGYFADIDGHIWEVAYNPFSTLGPNGEFRWSGY